MLVSGKSKQTKTNVFTQQKPDLCHLMPVPSKDQVLKGLNSLLQTKPDHMRQALSQFLLDLVGPKVTTPVVVPAAKEQHSKIPSV